jgi:hypothetical protein
VKEDYVESWEADSRGVQLVDTLIEFCECTAAMGQQQKHRSAKHLNRRQSNDNHYQ